MGLIPVWEKKVIEMCYSSKIFDGVNKQEYRYSNMHLLGSRPA